jgi:hypothetical protein
MAEGILFGVAQTMIENLGSQIFKEIGSLWGVKDEFEKIKNTVSTIRAVLLDAAEQQSHNHQVRDWLEKLKDAVYDADDLLGEFSTEAMWRSMVSGNKIAKEVRTFFSSSNRYVWFYVLKKIMFLKWRKCVFSNRSLLGCFFNCALPQAYFSPQQHFS